MKLDFIRHARSTANEEDIFSGSAETSLSEEGVLDAREIAKTIRSEHYQRHISSPLSRALGTAKILFPDSKILVEPRLVERSLGEWEGKAKKDMRARHPSAFLPSGKLHPLFTPPDGEDIPTVAKRLMEFLQIQIHDHIESMVVITHNGVIKTIRTLMEDLPIEDIFFAVERNLQVHTCTLDFTVLAAMEEKRLALAQIIRG